MAQTTIPPFSNQAILPPCATMCGPLFDVNGACVPPAAKTAAASVYTSCFCGDARLAPFSTGTVGVCDTVCTAGGLESIAQWYQGLCHVTADTATSGATSTSSGASAASTSSGSSGSSGDDSGSKHSGPPGSWISGHWQWVLMLVILVVGIAGIWIGACIWRRAYLRKKDRQNMLGQKHSGSATNPSWGPNGENSFGMTGNIRDSTRSNAPFVTGGGPVSAFEEEKPRRSEKVKRMFS